MKIAVLAAFLAASTSALAAQDNLSKYPFVEAACDGYAANLNAKRAELPAAIPDDQQVQFINDMYEMCLNGGRTGVAYAEAGRKIELMQPKPADTWTGRHLATVIADGYNYGQFVGAGAVEQARGGHKKKTSPSDIDDLLGDLRSGKNQVKRPAPAAGGSGVDISGYAGKLRDALEAKIIKKPEFSGRSCTARLKLTRNALLQSVTAEGGDSALCEALITAAKSTTFPPFPSDQMYEAFKNAVIDYKP